MSEIGSENAADEKEIGELQGRALVGVGCWKRQKRNDGYDFLSFEA